MITRNKGVLAIVILGLAAGPANAQVPKAPGLPQVMVTTNVLGGEGQIQGRPAVRFNTSLSWNDEALITNVAVVLVPTNITNVIVVSHWQSTNGQAVVTLSGLNAAYQYGVSVQAYGPAGDPWDVSGSSALAAIIAPGWLLGSSQGSNVVLSFQAFSTHNYTVQQRAVNSLTWMTFGPQIINTQGIVTVTNSPTGTTF